MLKRKFEDVIKTHFTSNNKKILLINGARQVGKTYIIEKIGRELFKNFIKIDIFEDSISNRYFEKATTIQDFYMQLSIFYGDILDKKENTLVFIDEIQTYPHLLTLLKFLSDDDRYTFVASGSLLGVTLSQTTSIPMGRVSLKQMYPLDFEEFLWANHVGTSTIDYLYDCFVNRKNISKSVHEQIFKLFKQYLFVGGMPEAVKTFVQSQNVAHVKDIQQEIHNFYKIDCAKYSKENKLNIQKVYMSVLSFMQNKKKRVRANQIENNSKNRFSFYSNDFEYLISSGICLGVNAISNPVFPLIESNKKNLIKLYLNDVGILSNVLYKRNINAIMDDIKSINLGALYETVVACELAAHGHNLFYYDNRNKGEVDYLIDDYDNLSVLPIEVKSGRDYQIHSAITNFVNNKEYHTNFAIVLNNKEQINQKNKILYMPVYLSMFL